MKGSRNARGGPVTLDRIEVDPGVMMGKPVIRGTRIPVETILRKLSEGATEASLFDAYPRLTREDYPGCDALRGRRRLPTRKSSSADSRRDLLPQSGPRLGSVVIRRRDEVR